MPTDTYRRSPEEVLDSLAVRILCGEGGCQKGKPCPFDPMCAADLTPESQHDLIIATLEATPSDDAVREAVERLITQDRFAATYLVDVNTLAESARQAHRENADLRKQVERMEGERDWLANEASRLDLCYDTVMSGHRGPRGQKPDAARMLQRAQAAIDGAS